MAQRVLASLPASRRAGWLSASLVVLAIWLGWQAIRVTLVVRADPLLAVQIAPTSPTALRRAAEAEYLAGRHDDAGALARAALTRAPFDAAALRVVGLSISSENPSIQELADADRILTLAGNWSLRDSPAHAWLVQQRLRQGDLRSAFSHADALARRRSDVQPATFALFTTGGKATDLGRAALTERMAAKPNWRSAYWSNLTASSKDEDQKLAAALALGLARTAAPLSDAELTRLYTQWLRQRRFSGLVELRHRMGGGVKPTPIADGSFETEVPPPFGWTFTVSPGVSAEVLGDQQRPSEQALRVDYDGFARGIAASQLVLLGPGYHQFKFDHRAEAGEGDLRLRWRIRCLDGPIVATSPMGGAAGEAWRSSSVTFFIPNQGCPAQRVELLANPGDRRTSLIVWLDRIVLSSADD